MTIQSRAVLREIRRLTRNGEDPLYINYSTEEIAAYPINTPAFSYAKYEKEIIGILLYLDKTGYIDIIDRDRMVFRLSHHGLHPHQFRAMVVIPGIVSAIVSITLYVLERLLWQKLEPILKALFSSW